MPRHPAPLLSHPGSEFGDQRGDLRLPYGEALLGGQAVDRPLGVEYRIDPPHRLGSQRRAIDFGELEQLAPAMRPARRLADRSRPTPRRVEGVVPGIGIGLQDPRVAGEVPLRMFGRPIPGVAEHRRRGRRAAEWPVVADKGPEPAGDGLAPGQHGDRGVVAVQPCGG